MKPKGSDGFVKALEKFIGKECEDDKEFAERVKASGKSAEDAARYVCNEVARLGRHGYADEEIFGMVRHFFDENLEAPKGWKVAEVVSNEAVGLTESERADAKKAAEERYLVELRNKEKEKALREEEERKKKLKERREAMEKAKGAQLDLFGFDM